MITTQLYSALIKICNLWRTVGAAGWIVLSVWTRVPRVPTDINTQRQNYRQIVDWSTPYCFSGRSKLCRGE